MNIQTLAAAMNIAYAVVRVDGFADEESAILAKEVASYNLSDEQRERVIEAYKQMNIRQAISIILESKPEDKREAEALTIVALFGDDELSDKEAGAFVLMSHILGFEGLKYDEARRIVGF